MKNIRIIIMVLLCVLSHNSIAQSSISNESSLFLPDHITGQFAGNIGVISAGFGYTSFSDKLSSDLMVGYVPSFIADVNIITITQKNTYKWRNFKMRKLERFYPTTGFSINIETGNNSFLRLPSDYPNGYYSTNAIKVGLFAGINYERTINWNSKFKQIVYYIECGTLANYLYYNIMRKNYFNPTIFSLALGIKLNLH